MQNKEFLVETKHGLYHCRDIKELSRKVTALKILNIEYQVYYENQSEFVKMQVDATQIV